MASKKDKLARNEILERKRIAERLRYQRLKNDPRKQEELREKERQKYLKKKQKAPENLLKRNHNKVIAKNGHETSISKIREMMSSSEGQNEVAKNALFGDVMMQQLTNNYLKLKSRKDKLILTRAVSGSLTKNTSYGNITPIFLIQKESKKLVKCYP
ncbi:hypothetical protein ABEB36_000231 [Hypothenemus hampei]|uniref:Uncharacterized protein n=1 Tax=Hypothenemus hampei TaxID=57062 RepID=A0ABD1FAK6_HYPHA